MGAPKENPIWTCQSQLCGIFNTEHNAQSALLPSSHLSSASYKASHFYPHYTNMGLNEFEIIRFVWGLFHIVMLFHNISYGHVQSQIRSPVNLLDAVLMVQKDELSYGKAPDPT